MNQNTNNGGREKINREEVDSSSPRRIRREEVASYGSEYMSECAVGEGGMSEMKNTKKKEDDDPYKEIKNPFEKRAIIGRSPTGKHEEGRRSEGQASREASKLKEEADRRKNATIRARDRANSLPDVRVHLKKVLRGEDKQDETGSEDEVIVVGCENEKRKRQEGDTPPRIPKKPKERSHRKIIDVKDWEDLKEQMNQISEVKNEMRKVVKGNPNTKVELKRAIEKFTQLVNSMTKRLKDIEKEMIEAKEGMSEGRKCREIGTQVEGRSIKEAMETEENLRLRQQILAKWQERWNRETERAQRVKILIPNIIPWIKCSHRGSVDYFLCQFLSGHGSFRVYTHKIGKETTNTCVYCGEVDTPDHTIFRCDRWVRQRLELDFRQDGDPTEVVARMVEDHGTWSTVSAMVKKIMSSKETEERSRQQAEARDRRAV